MKINIRLLSLLGILFTALIALASCSGMDISGSLAISAKRTAIETYAEFDSNDKLSSITTYANLYTINSDDEFVYSTQKTFTFENDIYTQTESVVFSNLKEETEYGLKLFVTYDNKAYEIYSTKVSTTPTGSTEDDPIVISTYDELMDMADDPDAYYSLNNDIDCGGQEIDNMFTSSNIFKGGFDGNNHIISNYVLTSNTYMGLFGYTNGATIKDLVVSDVKLTTSLGSSGRGETYLGAVVGRGINTTISNVVVSNVDFDITFYSTASVSIGAFAGRLNGCTVSNSNISNADIKIIRARRQICTGLFAGYVEGKTEITNCFAEGVINTATYFSTSTSVNDFNYVGGFIGVSGSRGLISNSYSKATIVVTEDTSKSSVSETHELAVGGFIGRNMQGIFNVDGCAAIADITVTSKYSKTANVGGLVGDATLSACIIKNSIYAPLDKGVIVNYVESSEAAPTAEEDEEEEEKAKSIIKVGLVIASETEITIENVYATSETVSCNTETDTLISGNYTLYSKELHQANLPEVIRNLIEQHLNTQGA